jgi:carbon starvation protein
LVITLTAGWQKLFHVDPRIGFLAHAEKFSAAVSNGDVLTPAKSLAQMQQVIVNDYINATLCVLFMSVVLVMLFCSVRAMWTALRSGRIESTETPIVLAGERA